MRKSSLGARKAGQPLRVSSDDFRASSTSRRTIDIRRGSGIPQPSVKGRRSSSETRDGRMSALQQPAVRRSRSQVNVYQGASAVTPMRGLVVPSLPGSSQSLRFTSPFSDGGQSSRKSVFSSIPSKPGSRVLKDTRPLTDKAYLQHEIQKISSFLNGQPDVLAIAPKGINLRQLTMKLFVDIVNYLLSFLDERASVNMTNYVSELPLILKRWGYVGNVNTSWLKTVNTPHSLPHVIGVLSWLVTLVSSMMSTDMDAVLENALQNSEDLGDDEPFPYGNALVYMQHLMKQYRLWNTDDRQGEEKEERMFIKGLCLRNGVSDEELAEISLAISNYEAQLNDPKEKAEMDAMKEEEHRFNEIMKDYNISMDFKVRMEEFLNSAETNVEEVKQKLRNGEEAVMNIRSSICELKELVDSQIMTVEERDDLLKKCNELSGSIRANEEFIAAVSNQSYSDDLEMAKMRSNIEKKTKAYNKIIVMESSWLPELESLKDDKNVLHVGAQEELAKIETLARQLKADFMKKQADLSTKLKEYKIEIQQAQERMNLLHQEREQYVSKVKQCEDSIDTFKTRSAKELVEMKKTIDLLETANESRINCTTLEEEKARYKALIEKRDYANAHIKRLKEKASYFFKQSVAITKNLMENVSAAEDEFFSKNEDLFKKAQAILEKIQADVEELVHSCN